MRGGGSQLDQQWDNAGQGGSFLADWAELTHVVHGMQGFHLDLIGVASLEVHRQDLDGAGILLDQAENCLVHGRILLKVFWPCTDSIQQTAFAACMQHGQLYKSCHAVKRY